MAGFKAGEFNQGSKRMLFRLLEPPAPVDGEQYPLVIWLHGVRGRGEDNVRQLTEGNSHAPEFFGNPEQQAKFPAYVLVPQCPNGKFWINFFNHGIRRPLKNAIQLVEHLMATLPIDPARIYVGGQSMGAFATWAVLSEYPHLFAAGIPVSGSGSIRKARKSLKAPVWIFHGANDSIVRVTRSREMAEALQKEGKPVIYTEYPTGRHDIWPHVFTEPEFADWLFSCKAAPPAKRRR
jgi:predicted peptidase